MTLLLAAWIQPADAACVEASTSSDLAVSVEAAEQAYGDMDISAFVAATDSLVAGLACLADPVTRSGAASVHRVVGLRAFVDQEDESAKLAFAAARSIQPAYRFPDTLIPAGNPVLSDYEAIPLSIGGTASAPALENEGVWRFDGREGTDRPTTWPSVVQAIDVRGAVRGTVYLWPHEALTAFDTTAEPVEVSIPAPLATTAATTEQAVATGPSRPLLIGAGAAAVLTGVSYALAASAAGEYRDLDTPDADLDGLRSRANGFTIGWAGGAALTAGLGASAFLVATW